MKINKQIEIVSSTMPGLSSMGKESREAICAVLSRHFIRVRVTIVNNLTDLEALAARRPDLVFLGMKFIPENPLLGWQDPDKIWLAEYLDMHGILYTGSDQNAHELELNKPLAKQRVLDTGLKTSPFFVAQQNKPQNMYEISLTFPMFIKPTNRGGGLGIDSDSVVHNFEQLKNKINLITTKHQSDSLIEEYLSGREFSVAILKDEFSDRISVMPLELIAPADKNGVRILSSKVKSADTEQFIAVTDNVIRAKICLLAAKVFRALEARDYGRIDIRMDEFGNPFFLEANLIPSLVNGYGNFPKACMLNMSLGYEQMLLSIVRLAFARSAAQPQNDPETVPIGNMLSTSLNTT